MPVHCACTLAILEFVAILLVSSFIYLANGITIGSGDTVPNTLLAFNLLEYHTLHFDIMRQAEIPSMLRPYGFFVEAANGHLTSHYPIGPAIVTFPLYLLFYLYLKLTGTPLNLVDGSFDTYRLLFEKLAATITTALSVGLFYLVSRVQFSRGISLVTTAIFAFATNTWVTSSQGLWQHGISNLMTLSAWVCLLRSHQAVPRYRLLWLGLAGGAVGLLPSIRPTSSIVTIALLVYVVAKYRWQAMPFFVGLLSAVPGLAWNWYYFGNLSGGYGSIVGSVYRFTASQFLESLAGLLISPSRGLLLFSPIVIFAIPGLVIAFRHRHQPHEQLLLCLSSSHFLIFITYCFYTIWWAGHCYGPRFMTDVLPTLCYLINYTLAEGTVVSRRWLGETPRLSLLFSVLLAFSVLTQVLGTFGLASGAAGRRSLTPNVWNEVPLDVDVHRSRLWDFQDNQIRRHANALLHRLVKPPVHKPDYQRGLRAKLVQVGNQQGVPLSPIVTGTYQTGALLTAIVENVGTSRWYGYNAALGQGETRVRASVFTLAGEKFAESWLYLSSSVAPGQTGSAIGVLPLIFPPGSYYLAFDLIADGIGDMPTENSNFAYELRIVAPANLPPSN
ncbi:MAG: hypothetical protein NZ772_04310 [Cyanobacteria bacterium]|nr:hypothetical protein [Cyanobacteriota bacterium]MDW8201169.1 hypothetical protein [Cyanobacteriota bacterium SKYGB_h_bin112]